VDITQDFAAFFGGDASLKYSGDAALVELVVDDGEGLAAAHDHACFCLVHWQGLPLKVAHVRFRPISSI
jgi:hypothetical protein